MSALLSLSQGQATSGDPSGHMYDTFAGYRFHDPSYITESLHPNYRPGVFGGRAVKSDLDLAWLGDPVLSLIYRDQWYPETASRKRNCAKDGWFTARTSNAYLAGVVEDSGIDQHCVLDGNQDMDDLSRRQRASMVEALVGGV
ncbi:hypothetical protein LTR65_006908 [Meristemomyces frigidus]